MNDEIIFGALVVPVDLGAVESQLLSLVVEIDEVHNGDVQIVRVIWREPTDWWQILLRVVGLVEAAEHSEADLLAGHRSIVFALVFVVALSRVGGCATTEIVHYRILTGQLEEFRTGEQTGDGE